MLDRVNFMAWNLLCGSEGSKGKGILLKISI